MKLMCQRDVPEGDYLSICDRLDQDGELEIEACSDIGCVIYLNQDQVKQLRDHLTKVLEG